MAELGKLSGKQIKLVGALAQGMSVKDAAQECQLSYRTAYRWFALPEVKQALKAARDELFNEQLQILRLGVRKAMATLTKHMSADVEPTSASQLQAARFWLENAIAVHKMVDLEARLAAMEEAVQHGPVSI